MKPNRIRRWLVPGTALAAMAAPLLLGGCPFDGPFDGPFGFADCEACAYCHDDPILEDPVPGAEDASLGSPEETRTDPQERPDGQGEETGDPERPTLGPTGNRIPDAVTRPKIDPDLRLQPGYAPPQNPSPKGKY